MLFLLLVLLFIYSFDFQIPNTLTIEREITEIVDMMTDHEREENEMKVLPPKKEIQKIEKENAKESEKEKENERGTEIETGTINEIETMIEMIQENEDTENLFLKINKQPLCLLYNICV